jgi:hypothetical protein
MTTFTSEELLSEAVELLPTRETLSLHGYGLSNWANVSATNVALAMNAGALLSHATAHANQAVLVTQL